MKFMKRPNYFSEECWFWLKVIPAKNSCWVWSGAKNNIGYGSLQWRGKSATAHVVAYTLLVGPRPIGLDLDHLCKNRSCVNINHLEPVTHKENILRGNSPAAIHAKKTHCVNGHPFKGKNLRVQFRTNGKTQRVCRACYAER